MMHHVFLDVVQFGEKSYFLNMVDLMKKNIMKVQILSYGVDIYIMEQK